MPVPPGPRAPAPELHVESQRPGELVGVDCFFVGRLHGTKGMVWQLTAIDVCSSFAWAELVACPSGQPGTAQTTRLARRVAGELRAAGWRLERVRSDNGSEFRGAFTDTLSALGARQTRIHAGRPQTNGAVEAHRSLPLPALPRPQARARALPQLLQLRPTAPTPAGSPAGGSRPTSSTVRPKWSRDEPHLSAHLRGCPP